MVALRPEGASHDPRARSNNVSPAGQAGVCCRAATHRREHSTGKRVLCRSRRVPVANPPHRWRVPSRGWSETVAPMSRRCRGRVAQVSRRRREAGAKPSQLARNTPLRLNRINLSPKIGSREAAKKRVQRRRGGAEKWFAQRRSGREGGMLQARAERIQSPARLRARSLSATSACSARTPPFFSPRLRASARTVLLLFAPSRVRVTLSPTPRPCPRRHPPAHMSDKGEPAPASPRRAM